MPCTMRHLPLHGRSLLHRVQLRLVPAELVERCGVVWCGQRFGGREVTAADMCGQIEVAHADECVSAPRATHAF